METETRLFLFKVVYKKTNDEHVIDEALRFESRKIRSWARKRKEEKGCRQRPQASEHREGAEPG